MRSQRKTATTLESRHVPVSAAAATTSPTPPRALRERVVGATAIALAASMAIQNAMFVGVDAPAYGDPIELVLAWHMHAAAFAWSLPALGTTFIGAALATHAIRLTPPWQRLLAVAGGGLLLAAGAANLAIAEGSEIGFVRVAGLAPWLVLLP